mgnify:CR=1 FL=1
MTESDFIKAIGFLFPKGNPLRELADFVSKRDTLGKLTSLNFIKNRIESEYKLAAFAQLYSPNNTRAKYLEDLSSALSECNNRIAELTNKAIQDEAQKKALDNIRDMMNRSGF